MSDLTKLATVVETNADTLSISMPFSKHNVENRTVSGFATLDNVDTSDDVVTTDASIEAFQKARGNVREMHDPKSAAGRIISYEVKEVFDPETDTTYKGIYVTVHVSKGAESTWQKVLDKTLTGFSIGGNIVDADSRFDKSVGRKVRVIKKYDLNELSLVDNPCNQLANVTEFIKSVQSSPETVVDPVSNIESVFWCDADTEVTTTTDASATCPKCQKEMVNMGWFENDPSLHKLAQVQTILNKYLEGGKNEVTIAVVEDEVTDEVVPAEEAVAVEETVVTDEVVEAPEVEVAEEAPVVEDAAEEVVNEEVSEDNDLEKSFESLQDRVNGLEKKLDDANNEVVEGFNKLTEVLADIKKSLDTTEISEQVEKLNSNYGVLAERLVSVEDDTAIRKSADRGDTVAPKKKDDNPLRGKIFNFNVEDI